MSDPVSPDMMTGAGRFAEYGTSGLRRSGGRIIDDFLLQLQGRRGTAIYREMSENHPIVGGVLAAIDMLFRSVEWSVEPADENNQAAVDEAEFVASCMTDMSTSWEDMISAALGFLVHGYSIHEIVYKRRAGETGDTKSLHDDSRVGWRKLPGRAQDTITEWVIDDNGGILGAIQTPTITGGSSTGGHGPVFLPIEKCLLFRTSSKLNNPEGRSILRSAYTSWFYQRRIAEIEAIGIERDLAGMPVALVPPQLLSSSATAAETAALDGIRTLVENIRRDEQEGIVFPLAYDQDSGNLSYELKLLTTGGRRQFDTNAVITRYDTRIAMTMLADFLLVGHDRVGTQSLALAKIELFQDSIAAYLSVLTDVFNTHAIPRLLRINGVAPDLTPILRHSSPRSPDLQTLADYVSELTRSGAIVPDPELDAHMREVAGLPIAETETIM